MCGILGYYSMDDKPLPGLDLMIAWALASARGEDACGAIWRSMDGHTWTFKTQGPSYDQAVRIAAHLAEPTRWVALHTRQATKGPAAENVNNHPVRYQHIQVVHNGIITNDDDVFRKLAVERRAKVDTEAIAACLAVGGIAKVVELCHGSLSIAWVDTRKPESLHLYTNGRSPLWASVGDNWLSFASTRSLMPMSLVGKPLNIKPGEHVLLRPDMEPRVTQVGVVQGWVQQTHRGVWRRFAEGDYECYDLECKTIGNHVHINGPAYTKDLHPYHMRLDNAKKHT